VRAASPHPATIFIVKFERSAERFPKELAAITRLDKLAGTAMVEKVITGTRNVLDFRSYQRLRKPDVDNAAARLASGPSRLCRHCGAAMLDGESDDDCSSAGLVAPALRAPPALRVLPRRFYAE
jgi:hypothetical protein